MSNDKKPAAPKSEWVRPQVSRIAAGSAESNGAGINDGGPLGNARS
ncbi:MAG TPA: hypothetical protein VFO69_03195 [Allosphingosinicella sp.]|nr:hypothetical protein [Allosphingosinicella sp.]